MRYSYSGVLPFTSNAIQNLLSSVYLCEYIIVCMLMHFIEMLYTIGVHRRRHLDYHQEERNTCFLSIIIASRFVTYVPYFNIRS